MEIYEHTNKMKNTTNSDNYSLSYDLHETNANISSAMPQDPHTFLDTVMMVEKCLVPLICICGFVGNTISCVLFLQKSLRISSCSIFLAARSVTDNGFLTSVFVVWISSTFKLQLSHIPNLCKVLAYVTYVCACMSVWLVVFLTIENYLRICRPVLVQRFCNTKRARNTIVVSLFLFLCFYQVPLWIFDEFCIPVPKYVELTNVLVYGDTLITLIIPTIVIFLSLCSITAAMLRSFDFRRRRSSTSQPASKSLLGKVTGMLYSVTVSFFCLSLPSHILRLRVLIKSFADNSNQMSATDAAIQTIALLIYYLSMSINFCVYYTFGSSFRKSFNGTFCGCCSLLCKQYRPKVTRSGSEQLSKETVASRKTSYVALHIRKGKV